jgi:hypothetical protein
VEGEWRGDVERGWSMNPNRSLALELSLLCSGGEDRARLGVCDVSHSFQSVPAQELLSPQQLHSPPPT